MECKHNQYKCLLSSPWQDLEDTEEPDTFNIVSEGETLELECLECGHIWHECFVRYDLREE